MVLNISPISDPEDIRREAGIASPPPTQAVEATEPQAVTQPSSPSVAPTDVAVAEQPTPTEPEIASTAAPSSFHIDEAPSVDVSAPTTTAAVEPNIQAPEPVQSPPVVLSPSIYPDPQALKAQKQEHATFTESETAGSYIYKMPVGVYVIAAFGIPALFVYAVQLFMMNGSLLSSLGTASGEPSAWIGPIIASLAVALLAAKDIIRWLAAVAFAGAFVYYGYFLIKMIGDYQKVAVVAEYGFGGIAKLVLGLILIMGLYVAAHGVAAYYLLRPNVAKAFK